MKKSLKIKRKGGIIVPGKMRGQLPLPVNAPLSERDRMHVAGVYSLARASISRHVKEACQNPRLPLRLVMI